MFIQVRPEIKAEYAEIQGYILGTVNRQEGRWSSGNKKKRGECIYRFITPQRNLFSD